MSLKVEWDVLAENCEPGLCSRIAINKFNLTYAGLKSPNRTPWLPIKTFGVGAAAASDDILLYGHMLWTYSPLSAPTYGALHFSKTILRWRTGVYPRRGSQNSVNIPSGPVRQSCPCGSACVTGSAIQPGWRPPWGKPGVLLAYAWIIPKEWKAFVTLSMCRYK